MNPLAHDSGWKRRSHSAALGLAAAVMLVPANILPVLSTAVPGQARTDTIFSGIVGLCDSGMWAIGAIVFTASILIPALKLAGLGWLLLSARTGATKPKHARGLTRLYTVLDFIGRWSMLDVFLVAFLTGAVRFGSLAQVEPHAGIIAFAAAVVLTVLATATFDPRWLWSDAQRSADEPSSP